MPIHAEQRVIAYTPDQVYGLVADVERYPEFLPWCMAARIRKRDETWLVADLVIGFRMIRERFTSHVALDEDHRRIDVVYAEGPFKHMENHWRFEDHDEGCLIDFYVDFEFRSKLLQKLIEALFHEAVKRMVSAFEARAKDLYGTPNSAKLVE